MQPDPRAYVWDAHQAAPGVIAAEIVEDLRAAVAEFTELAESLQGIGVEIEE